ncbi:hypothetical protein [Flavobacterium alvei]|uniref:hypothetical protein n=1 Tax=Flavobacterium alvei TaxID=2080416 RepID=UPI0026EBD6FD|nr:hypothetical protein [Flavobacterium alvei]
MRAELTKSKEDIDFYNIMHRFDNTVISMNSNLPYPFIQGDCLNDYSTLDSEFITKNAINMVHGEIINPFALGHKLNHPPKDVCPNVIA